MAKRFHNHCESSNLEAKFHADVTEQEPVPASPTCTLLDLPKDVDVHIFRLLDLVDLLRLHATNSLLAAFLISNAAHLELKRKTIVYLLLRDSETEFRFLGIGGVHTCDDERPKLQTITRDANAFGIGSIVFNVETELLTEDYQCIILRPVEAASLVVVMREIKRLLGVIRLFLKPSYLRTNVHEDEFLEFAPYLPKSFTDLAYDENHIQDEVKCCANHVSSADKAAFLMAIEKFPSLITLHARFRKPASRSFFDSPKIKNLYRINMHTKSRKDRESFLWMTELDDETLLRMPWKKAQIGVSLITLKGLHLLLQQWMKKERDIELIVLRFRKQFDMAEAHDLFVGMQNDKLRVERDDGQVLTINFLTRWIFYGFHYVEIK